MKRVQMEKNVVWFDKLDSNGLLKLSKMLKADNDKVLFVINEDIKKSNPMTSVTVRLYQIRAARADHFVVKTSDNKWYTVDKFDGDVAEALVDYFAPEEEINIVYGETKQEEENLKSWQ